MPRGSPDFEDLTAHLLALIITVGFFVVIMFSLLGVVDLHDPATSSFVGLVLGNVSGLATVVLARYFKKEGITIKEGVTFKDDAKTDDKNDTTT